MTTADVILGGLSVAKEADKYVQELCLEVKASVEGKTNQTYDLFVAMTYRSQTVSGKKYFIKVGHGDPWKP
ncbi:hypothetical protein NHX12_029535 [Muraenolepis orangiensis]|uniref:Cystatin domain-containing protein n=1 Tax=Muraenolepis orangiensis TaxID=630683 RepID=A0A9Q0D7C7_9TELE|nr:hypothetical protein NHX12_029535 [Muraenolepis orangiensis]